MENGKIYTHTNTHPNTHPYKQTHGSWYTYTHNETDWIYVEIYIVFLNTSLYDNIGKI